MKIGIREEMLQSSLTALHTQRMGLAQRTKRTKIPTVPLRSTVPAALCIGTDKAILAEQSVGFVQRFLCSVQGYGYLDLCRLTNR